MDEIRCLTVLEDAKTPEALFAGLKAAGVKIAGAALEKLRKAERAGSEDGEGGLPWSCPHCHAARGAKGSHCRRCGGEMTASSGDASTGNLALKSESDSLLAAYLGNRVAKAATTASEFAASDTDAGAQELLARDPRLTPEQARGRYLHSPRAAALYGVAAIFGGSPASEALAKYAGGLSTAERSQLASALAGRVVVLGAGAGVGAKGSDSAAYAEIVRKADEMLKADRLGTLSPEQARARVIKRHPELYRKYADAMAEAARAAETVTGVSQ